MMNFDMVGRLRADNTLAINGIGTSNKWKKLINNSNKFNFNLKTTDSGIGPSDHTSFYLQDIPSIHFFTANMKTTTNQVMMRIRSILMGCMKYITM